MLVRVQPLQQNIIIKFKFMSFQFIEPTEEQKKQNNYSEMFSKQYLMQSKKTLRIVEENLYA